MNVQDLWSWLANDVIDKLNVNKTLYNASLRTTYANFDSYANDATSILIGYPILRQLRVEKGK